MEELFCPICKRVNDATAERCWYCQAVLKSEPNNPPNNTDWLNNLRSDSDEPGEPEETTVNKSENSQTPEEEVPDWLSRIRLREEIDRNAQKAHENDAKTDKEREDIPDWLREIKSGIETPDQKSFEENESLVDRDDSTIEKSESSNPLVSESSNDEEKSDWLNQFTSLIAETPNNVEGGKTQPEDEAGMEPDTQTPFTDQPTDELKIENFEDQQPSTARSNESPEKPLVEDLNNEIIKEEESIIDLLREGSEFTPPEETASTTFSKQKDEFDDVNLTQLDNGEKTEPIEGEFAFGARIDENIDDSSRAFPAHVSEADGIEEEPETTAIPFLSAELPEWLGSEGTHQPQKPIGKVENQSNNIEEPENPLERGNLPAWLEAFRPVESVNLPSPAIKTPEVGPSESLLAGIEGALHATGMAGGIKKPSELSSCLKISERQKTNANILSELMDDSLGDIEIAVDKGRKLTSSLIRALLAIVMFVSVFLGGTFLRGFVIFPELFPAEVVQFYDLINALPVEKPILLAVDFEAAFSGELRWSSQTIIEHIMRRNLKIVLISTNPVGSAIVLDQIRKSGQTVNSYPVDQNVIDLGYLPGGSVAIQSLNGSFKNVLPMTAGLQPINTVSILDNVSTLKDFGAIILLTEKTETSRNWIEQIQPGLLDTPFIMVTSAQAAPLIRPYYQSGQIDGFVSGLPGSLAYEQMLQTAGPSVNHLGTFQIMLVLITTLLLVSGFISLFIPIQPDKKEV
jgi:hypothetical protein